MKYLKDFIFVLILIVIDQLTKLYFIGKHIYLFKYFSFNFVANTGISFGFFKGYNILFILISLLVILFVFYFYNKEKKHSLAFNFILAGAFGNLIDRIFRGYVIDFVDLGFWPVFNLADVFVTCGALLLLYYMMKEKD